MGLGFLLAAANLNPIPMTGPRYSILHDLIEIQGLRRSGLGFRVESLGSRSCQLLLLFYVAVASFSGCNLSLVAGCG